jgi:hypothetical protein
MGVNMKNKMKQFAGVLFLLLIAGSFLTAKPCLAASAEVELSSDTAEVTIGDNIFVYINIKSESSFGDFEANLTYDDDILEYRGGASVITGSSGFLKISDMGITEGSTTRKYTLKFEALQVGMCEISFSGRAIVYDFETGYDMSVSSNVLTLDVKAAETASNNANLKSLKISSVELTPAFDKNILEYNVNVGFETEKLIINALTEDGKATVSISGNDLLKEGENKVVVTVLAESGDVIEYTINVFRESAPADGTPSGEPVISPGASHGLFEVVEIDGEKYAVYSGRYKLIEPDSEVVIPNGYIETKIIVSGISITAYSPENNFESEFLLIYAMNEFGEEGYYQYDRIEKTLQRYVTNTVIGNDNTDITNTEDYVSSQEYRNNLNKAAIVIALLSALSVLLIIVVIRLFFRIKGYKEDDLD